MKFLILGVFLLGFYCEYASCVSLSSRLASSVCQQRNKFFKSQRVQPAQKKPPNEKVPCGKFQSQKCIQEKTLRCEESNPVFKFQPCGKSKQVQKSGRSSSKRGRTADATVDGADWLKKLGGSAPPIAFLRLKKSSTIVTSEMLKNLPKDRFSAEDRRLNRKRGVTSLRALALESQNGILNFIKRRRGRNLVKTTSLWLTNQILLQGADLTLLKDIYGNFSQDILEITADKKFKLVKSKKEEAASGKDGDGRSTSYGVEAIEADKVWAEGNKGEGVIVGIIDTGALGNHTYFQDNFVGLPNGWYDGMRGIGTEEPVDKDINGHGTHVTGIIVATEQKIGVAPGSKWMSCAACDGETCPKSSILKCLQWMICPEKRPTDGGINAALRDFEDADCEGTPHVINNSWGNEEDDDVDSAIKGITAVGIIQVFAAGNGGPDCGTVGSPAHLEGVISVGASTAENVVADFSSRGPLKNGDSKLVKPEIVAPGEYVLSTGNTLDTAVTFMSGTSQSAPHVTGTIALLLHEKPDLTLEQVKEILQKSAVPLKTGENEVQECGGVKETEVPNFTSGHGLLNAYKAVQYLKEHFKN